MTQTYSLVKFLHELTQQTVQELRGGLLGAFVDAVVMVCVQSCVSLFQLTLVGCCFELLEHIVTYWGLLVDGSQGVLLDFSEGFRAGEFTWRVRQTAELLDLGWAAASAFLQ